MIIFKKNKPIDVELNEATNVLNELNIGFDTDNLKNPEMAKKLADGFRQASAKLKELYNKLITNLQAVIAKQRTVKRIDISKIDTTNLPKLGKTTVNKKSIYDYLIQDAKNDAATIAQGFSSVMNNPDDIEVPAIQVQGPRNKNDTEPMNISKLNQFATSSLGGYSDSLLKAAQAHNKAADQVASALQSNRDGAEASYKKFKQLEGAFNRLDSLYWKGYRMTGTLQKLANKANNGGGGEE